MKNGAVVTVLLVVIATFLLQVAVDLPEGVSAYTPRDPIYVYGNENFTTENGVVGGSGLWNDPFVISDWEISAPDGRAIHIENTTAHFSIENVYVRDDEVPPALYILQSSNGTVVDSLMENNLVAVFLGFSTNISISATNFIDCELGVRVWNSSKVSVSGITFQNVRRLVDIRSSLFVSAHNNTASGGGIFIDGSLKEHFNSHEIFENNTAGGKPIRYFKNCSGIRLDAPVAAQIIMANCTGVDLTNLSISGTETALEFAFVRNGTVSRSFFSQTYIGVTQFYSSNITYQNVTISEASQRAAWIRHSDTTTFEDCHILLSHIGIEVTFSHRLLVRRTSFFSGAQTGLGVASMYSSHIQFESNTLQEMLEGFSHWRGDNVSIARNEFHGINYPIDMAYSNNSVIVENILMDSGSPAVYASALNRATIANNTVLRSRTNGFLITHITNSTIKGNRVDSVAISGIHACCGTNNVISENYVLNSYMGMSMGPCYTPDIFPNNNIVSRNSVVNNTIGIEIRDSHDNRFFHNNMINNSIQAQDDSASDNEWDDGYPSGGNYWSNYTDPDDFGGPNQDIPGSDGIGDLPFDFDPDTRDNYPLMSPTIVLSPDAPSNLDAELSGGRLENITISWHLSLDDINGQRSVVRYDILRSSNYSRESSDYVWYDSVPKGTSLYVDTGAGEGDPYDYFYLVCAVDSSGNFTCSYDQPAKFTRPLASGPSLVSIPLVQSNESIETGLQTVEYDKVWYYDSSSQEWEWYMTPKGYRRGLLNVDHAMGIWVNVTGDCNLTVAGVVLSNANIQLRSGWNLVGFASFNVTYTVGDLKAHVGATRVEGYGSMSAPYYLRVLENAEVLQTGYAYWVRVEADVAWSVPIQ